MSLSKELAKIAGWCSIGSRSTTDYDIRNLAYPSLSELLDNAKEEARQAREWAKKSERKYQNRRH